MVADVIVRRSLVARRGKLISLMCIISTSALAKRRNIVTEQVRSTTARFGSIRKSVAIHPAVATGAAWSAKRPAQAVDAMLNWYVELGQNCISNQIGNS